MKKNILVVDDSALMRRAICDIINSSDEFEATDTCRDGLEAYGKIKAGGYDAVLLDINMPRMNGLELLQKLQKENIRATVVVVSSLAKEDAKITIQAMEYGAIDFLTKPENIIEAKGLQFRKSLTELLNAVLPPSKARGPAAPAAGSQAAPPQSVRAASAGQAPVSAAAAASAAAARAASAVAARAGQASRAGAAGSQAAASPASRTPAPGSPASASPASRTSAPGGPASASSASRTSAGGTASLASRAASAGNQASAPPASAAAASRVGSAVSRAAAAGSPAAARMVAAAASRTAAADQASAPVPPAAASAQAPPRPASGGKKLIALASSTGGPKALQSVIPYLDKNMDAPMVLVQHMPTGFTKSMAERLNELSKVEVKEAEDDEVLKDGWVYVAPGGYHLEVVRARDGSHKIHLSDAPPIGSLRPCANVMYQSLKRSAYGQITCVVLTGMGADGTEGIRELRKSKPVYVISQDEPTCVVYGMPKAVAEAGLTDEVVPLADIPKRIINQVGVK